jgi:hypothetical protein
MKSKFLKRAVLAIGLSALVALTALPVMAADPETKDGDKFSDPKDGTTKEESHGELLNPGTLKPAFPVIFWDETDFTDMLGGDTIVIDFDTYPNPAPNTNAAFPTLLDRDGNVVGPALVGDEWISLGAVFSSPAGAALRTVSEIDYYSPDLGGPTSDRIFFDRANGLSVGAAPFTSPISTADNNGVPDENDDSLIIDLVTPKVGVGFYIIDQNAANEAGESIIFRDVNGLVITTISSLPEAQIQWGPQFIGLISYTRAIAQIEIVENWNNGDDIAYDHFVLNN